MNLLNLSVKLPIWAEPLYEGLTDGLFHKEKDIWIAQAKTVEEKNKLVLYTSFLGLFGVPYEIQANSVAPKESPFSCDFFFKAFLLDSSRSFSPTRDLRTFAVSSDDKVQFLKSVNELTELPPVGWQHRENVKRLSRLMIPEELDGFRLKSPVFLEHLIKLVQTDPLIFRMKDCWETSLPQWAIATINYDKPDRWLLFFDKCVESGVDIHSKNRNGNTLAHGVIFNTKNQELCDTLFDWCVDHEIDWSALNKAGNDALSLYKFNRHRDYALSPFKLDDFHGIVHKNDWLPDADVWVSNWQKKILEKHVGGVSPPKREIEAL